MFFLPFAFSPFVVFRFHHPFLQEPLQVLLLLHTQFAADVCAHHINVVARLAEQQRHFAALLAFQDEFSHFDFRFCEAGEYFFQVAVVHQVLFQMDAHRIDQVLLGQKYGSSAGSPPPRQG